MNDVVFLILGDRQCGKTSISARYVDDDFSPYAEDCMDGFSPRPVLPLEKVIEAKDTDDVPRNVRLYGLSSLYHPFKIKQQLMIVFLLLICFVFEP